MFKRILVPVDFTPKSREAVAVANRFARESEATVILLHIIETVQDAQFDELRELHARAESTAREKMAQLVAEVLDPALPFETRLVEGSRSKEQEIVEFAKGNEIDLIVMASHRVQPEPGRGVGTVSYKVGILAPCAIILVK
ncbi:MAG: universal stress protein [Planctomycetota bacterium]